ncbi:20258_t:CDS:2 [Gigaspora margarita]|uniref:20258_t:CDS:1 n=1 Tax=Gigaspora margarita TaxID=4874 RepID=A0ABN7VFY1_GIGMA|nr:20258_t:CDS:2 [Gigaspora margarita]
MSSTKNNKSRYRDGCIGPGYRALKNSFLGNLFRKLTFKSGRSQETTNNSSFTNSDLTNSIINNNNFDTKIQTPQKIKIKSVHNQSLKIDDIWERYSNINVALKCLLELKKEDFTNELFKELKSHLISNDQVIGRFNILRTYGMTRDPNSKVYMMVMTLADDGDLSAYMKKHFSTLTFVKRLNILYDIATGLYQIHNSGLMHRDLHSGNVMCQRLKDRDPSCDEEYQFLIGDLEFKKGDEFLKTTQLQTLHPNNVLYSTYHDTKDNDNEDSTFDISDSLYKVADSLDNIDLDELSIMHSVNIEDIKKENALKSSYLN